VPSIGGYNCRVVCAPMSSAAPLFGIGMKNSDKQGDCTSAAVLSRTEAKVKITVKSRLHT